MELDEIKLHCSGCKPSRWIIFPRDKVTIRLSLDKDQYEFEASCPLCGGDILNLVSMHR